ncbi:MAG TPA: beta-galactosidase [Terriglobia bacterium]|nr:beta-galactosidase [Terriglobia bacterium]
MERIWIRAASGLIGVYLLMGLPVRGQQSPSVKPFDLIEWNGGKFVYGADYYPEAWDESQWEKDAVMMQEAGFNFVRMGEFAWAKMEPREGHYDFAWLDRALKVLNSHGVRAVLGTPTASPPAWLYAKYPDIAAMDEKGNRYRYGSRRNYCVHNPDFIAATRRIVTAMAEHYKDHPGVIGWQIDNEVGDPKCFDPVSRAAFQAWCQRKYHTLDALNAAWGTVFWGHTYQTWQEIPLPWNTLYDTANPSLALDFERFQSDSTHAYVDIQASILRKLAPRQAITHNEMGMFPGVDYYDLNRSLDFVAWDNYPIFQKDYSQYAAAGLAHDLMRGSKDNQNFMIMEQEGGLGGWATFGGHQAPAALYRVWAYQSVAHGADGVCYFRWRTSRYGTEQYWQGILDQDSYRNSRYEAVAQAGKELGQLTSLLHGSKVVSPVAMLVSPDSRWAQQIQPGVPDFEYDRQLHDYYDAFRRTGISVDVAFPQSDLSAYRILVAPALFVTDQPLSDKLHKFVLDGGTLILTFRSGVKDEHNVVTDKTLPGPFADLAGVAIHEFDPQLNEEQELLGLGASNYPARTWCDILDPTTARVVATYGKSYYAGKAAVTENRAGKGWVFYVGTESKSPLFYDRMIAFAAAKGNVAVNERIPPGVEVEGRQKGGIRIVFVLNYTAEDKTVPLDQAYRNALTGKPESMDLKIPAYQVVVLTP